jgi:hypothetical protein
MTNFRAELEAIDAEIASILGNRREWRLTAPAFLDAALALAKCDEARLDEIEAELAQPGLDELRRAIARCERHVADDHMTYPTMAIGWMFDSEADAQIGIVGSTRLEILALAVRKVVRRAPECFGRATRIGATQERLNRLQEERAELATKVELTSRLGGFLPIIEEAAAIDAEFGAALEREVKNAIRRGRARAVMDAA